MHKAGGGRVPTQLLPPPHLEEALVAHELLSPLSVCGSAKLLVVIPAGGRGGQRSSKGGVSRVKWGCTASNRYKGGQVALLHLLPLKAHMVREQRAPVET